MRDVDAISASVPFYRNTFRSRVNTDVEASVSDIGTFMFSDYTEVPDTPMRPPQLGSASGDITGGGDVEFDWDSQAYSPGKDYGNHPDGYRLYKDGQLVATASFPATGYTYSPSGPNSGEYRLTAYNETGESLGASSTLDLGIEASISGPSSVSSGQQGTWTASVSGGSGSTSYDWEYQSPGSSSWSSAYCSGSSCSHTFNNYSSTAQYGKMKVTVTKGSASDAASMTVSVSPSCGDQVFICRSATSKDVLALQHFEARGQSQAAGLTWSTVGTASPSQFVVQHRTDTTAAWSELGTVEAADSTQADTIEAAAYRFETDDLDVGTHQFRLAAETPDGQRHASKSITAAVEMDDPYQLKAYPNPARNRATVGLAVKERQEVEVQVYDLLGGRGATLHDGPLPAQETRRLSLEVSRAGLTSGAYFVRAVGEDFAAMRRLTVVR